METRWLYATSEEIPKLCEASKGVCVIPMGCVEKHGLHLPLGTDILIASEISYMASQLETACVLPDFIFGDVPEGAPSMHPGTITIKTETQMQLLEQLCEQASRNGFKRILVYNGHGGNAPWLSVFCRILTSKKRDFIFGSIETPLPVPHKFAEEIEKNGPEFFPELTKEDIDIIMKRHAEKMKIGHACLSETAFIHAIAPESVHLDRLGIEDGLNKHKTDALKDVGIRCHGYVFDFPNAFGGNDPIDSNERIGKAALRYEAENLARAIKVWKEADDIWELHNEYQRGW